MEAGSPEHNARPRQIQSARVGKHLDQHRVTVDPQHLPLGEPAVGELDAHDFAHPRVDHVVQHHERPLDARDRRVAMA